MSGRLSEQQQRQQAAVDPCQFDYMDKLGPIEDNGGIPGWKWFIDGEEEPAKTRTGVDSLLDLPDRPHSAGGSYVHTQQAPIGSGIRSTGRTTPRPPSRGSTRSDCNDDCYRNYAYMGSRYG